MKNFKKEEKIQYRAYAFSLNVINLLKRSKKHDYINEVLFKQILRSVTSIGANIIEGQAGISRKEFRNYMSIALKSANETKYWLALIRDLRIFVKDDVDSLIEESIEIANILGAIVFKLRKND